MKETKIDKSLVGKYVCFTKPDGSFTWGRIVNQGLVNTSKGEKRVLIMEDQLTCRVAQNQLELETMKRLERRISRGTAGPTYLPGSSQKMLPDYQREAPKQLGKGSHEKKETSLMRATPEGSGLVPSLEQEMTLRKSEGLAMNQRVGMVRSRTDGHEINFALRQFGYNTIVFQDSLNLQTDIIDPESAEYRNLTDEAMFHKAMRRRESQGHQNELMGSGGKGLLGR